MHHIWLSGRHRQHTYVYTSAGQHSLHPGVQNEQPTCAKAVICGFLSVQHHLM